MMKRLRNYGKRLIPQKVLPYQRFERRILKQLNALQSLLSDKKMAERLKIQPSKHVIKIPKAVQRDEKAQREVDRMLHKLLIKERKRWVEYINQNPRNAMTDDRANALIEKLATSKR
jgi:hypothetical protein